MRTVEVSYTKNHYKETAVRRPLTEEVNIHTADVLVIGSATGSFCGVVTDNEMTLSPSGVQSPTPLLLLIVGVWQISGEYRIISKCS